MNWVLWKARQKLGFSQLEMAAFVGVPNYAEYENGKSPYDRKGRINEKAIKISNMLDLQLHEAFEEIPQIVWHVSQELLDDYPDDPIYEPTNLYDFKELLPKINKVLRTLSPREDAVIRMRFGLRYDDDTPMTLDQVAQQFDVGKERIRQVEAKGIRKLRHFARAKDLVLFLPENNLLESQLAELAYKKERRLSRLPPPQPEKQYEIVKVLKEVRYGKPFYAGNRRIWSPLYEDQRTKILDLQHVIDKTAIVPHEIGGFHFDDLDLEHNVSKWPERGHVCMNCGAETILLASGHKKMDAVKEIIRDGNGNPVYIIYGERIVRNHIHIICISGCTVFVTVTERREKV